MSIQIRRTRTPNLAPTGLLPGQPAVEMGSAPPRLWFGVPADIDPTLRREFAPFARASVWSTGDVKITLKQAPDPGWLMCNDGTIGNAESGANYANVNARDLFLLLYESCTDAIAPITTSAGTATTRTIQGTPANAWANNVRLRLTLMLGRALAIAGSGAGLSVRNLGDALGQEAVGLNTNLIPSHAHTLVPHYTYAAQGGGGVGYTLAGAGNTSIEGGSLAHNSMQPTSFLNIMIRL